MGTTAIATNYLNYSGFLVRLTSTRNSLFFHSAGFSKHVLADAIYDLHYCVGTVLQFLIVTIQSRKNVCTTVVTLVGSLAVKLACKSVII
jgi:hypothetical protein